MRVKGGWVGGWVGRRLPSARMRSASGGSPDSLKASSLVCIWQKQDLSYAHPRSPTLDNTECGGLEIRERNTQTHHTAVHAGRYYSSVHTIIVSPLAVTRHSLKSFTQAVFILTIAPL